MNDPLSVTQRRAVVHVRQQIAEVAERIKGLPSTDAVRRNFAQQVAAKLQPLHEQGLFRNFTVSDRTTPEQAEQGIFNMGINLQPDASADYVEMTVEVQNDELQEIAKIIEEVLGEELFPRE